MRDLIYYVACSLDGYIADPNGSFEKFPWNDEVVSDFFASYDWFDTVIMGRKTYDVAYLQDIVDPYPNLKTVVFSESMDDVSHPNVSIERGDVLAKVKALKEMEGKPIWLCGGGNLAGQLHEAALLDQLIVKLNPIVLGDGIPLFAGSVKFANLTLTKVKEYDIGTSLRHYNVQYD